MIDAGAWPAFGRAVAALENWGHHLADLTPVPLAETADPVLGYEVVDDPHTVFARLMEARQVLSATLDWVRGADVTAVVTPDSRGVEILRDILSGTALLGLPVRRIVVNRLHPHSSTRQVDALTEMRSLTNGFAPGCALELVPEALVGNDLVPGMDDVAAPAITARPGAGDPGGRPGPRLPFATSVVRRADHGYDLVLPTGPEPVVRLDRRGMDLLVRAGGIRRHVRLSGALARCEVGFAEQREDTLVVRLTPRRGLWPRE